MDAWLKGKPKKQRSYIANMCTISLLIMLSIVYVASFIHKYENAWQVWFVQGTLVRSPFSTATELTLCQGDATYYALNLRFFRRPLGDLILSLG